MLSLCAQDNDACTFMQERSAIYDMCGEIFIEEYKVDSLNMHIRRNLSDSRNEVSRLAAESAQLLCERMGVEGVRLESKDKIEQFKKQLKRF